jgi:site-specific recombinase XerD
MSQPLSSRTPAPDDPGCTDAQMQERTALALSPDDTRVLDELDRKHEAFVDHARHVLNHSAATCRLYRHGYLNFRRFLLIGAGRVELAVRIHAIEEWVAWNRKRGCSAVSTNTYWRALSPFYAYLEKREGLQSPFRGMKMPRVPVALPKARTADECRRILSAAANYPWRTEFQRVRAVAIFGLLIFAGLRRGEVTRLLYTDVNLEAGTIRILKGKGRHGGKDRTAYMNDELRNVLKAYVRERARRRYVCPEFFVSIVRGQGLSVGQLIRIVKAVRRASGIPFSIHSLRHSFVTMLLQSGVPIHVAKELAGHTDINTTAGYLRVWDDEQRTQIRRLKL